MRRLVAGLILVVSLAACSPREINAVIHAQRSQAQGHEWCAEDDAGWNGHDHVCLPVSK